MTHEEMLDRFVLNKLTTGTLVTVTLNNGEVVNVSLSYDKVMGEMIDGKVANSRIGLISSDDSGSILGRVKPTPIYTTDITDISIYKP